MARMENVPIHQMAEGVREFGVRSAAVYERWLTSRDDTTFVNEWTKLQDDLAVANQRWKIIVAQNRRQAAREIPPGARPTGRVVAGDPIPPAPGNPVSQNAGVRPTGRIVGAPSVREVEREAPIVIPAEENDPEPAQDPRQMELPLAPGESVVQQPSQSPTGHPLTIEEYVPPAVTETPVVTTPAPETPPVVDPNRLFGNG